MCSWMKIPSNITIQLSELAFKAKITPLFEIENGILTLNKKPEQDVPVERYLMLQGRFKHLKKTEIEEIHRAVLYQD